MQGFSPHSVMSFVKANSAQRHILLSDLVRQGKNDLRRAQWAWLRRSGRRFALTRGTESYLVRVGEDAISRSLFIYGEFDFYTVELARQILDRPQGFRKIADIGANIGPIAIAALSRGLAETVLAVEPERANMELLKINASLNNVSDRFKFVEAAVGDGQLSAVELSINAINFGDHRIVPLNDSRQSVVNVPTVTLDDICSDFDASLDLIVMDIQGYEGHALRGAADTLHRCIPIIMEIFPEGLIEHGTTGADLVDLLHDYNRWYDLRALNPEPREIHELADLFNSLAPSFGTDANSPRDADILLV
jgi:FkbM family methyltransferase